MKEMKKVASFLMAGVLTVCGMSSVRADAGYCAITSDKLLSSISKYDADMFKRIDTDYGLYSNEEEGTYIPFWGVGKYSKGFMLICDLRVNFLYLQLQGDSGWEDIYEKYKDVISADCVEIDYKPSTSQIDGDKSESEEYNEICLYDIPEIKQNIDAENELTNFIQYESKAHLIAQMCEEMKAAGVIVEGSYEDYYGRIEKGWFVTLYDTAGNDTGIYSPLKVYDQTLELAFLQDVAAQFDEEIVVTECYDEEDQKYYEVSGITDAEMMYGICGKVRESYPESEFSEHWVIGESNDGLATESVDILSGVPEAAVPIYGDINEDCSLGMDDASEALSIYAKQAASLAVDEYTADQLFAADADSNGVIDLDDASVILSYYAKTAAGLEPTWDEVLAG